LADYYSGQTSCRKHQFKGPRAPDIDTPLDTARCWAEFSLHAVSDLFSGHLKDSSRQNTNVYTFPITMALGVYDSSKRQDVIIAQ
jgi:hypothetical protein